MFDPMHFLPLLVIAAILASQHFTRNMERGRERLRKILYVTIIAAMWAVLYATGHL